LDYIENDKDFVKDRIALLSRIELFELNAEAKFYGLRELENITLSSLGLMNNDDCANVFNHHLTGGKLKLVKYTFYGGANVYNANTEEGAPGNSWNNNGMFIDEGTFKDHEEFSFRTNRNAGTTWSNSAAGESVGVVMADLTQNKEETRAITKFCVFQMSSDGATSHIRISYFPDTINIPTNYEDNNWIIILDWTEVGPYEFATVDELNVSNAENFGADSVMKRTESWTVPTFETRFIKIEVKNDGRNGSAGYIELRQIKAFS